MSARPTGSHSSCLDFLGSDLSGLAGDLPSLLIFRCSGFIPSFDSSDQLPHTGALVLLDVNLISKEEERQTRRQREKRKKNPLRW